MTASEAVYAMKQKIEESIDPIYTPTKVSIAQLATDAQPTKREKKFISKVEELKKRFSQDAISLGEYVSAISKCTAI